MDRIVITGMGLMTPLGSGVEPVWEAILNQQTGVHRLDDFAEQGYACSIGARIDDFQPEEHLGRRTVKRNDRFLQLLMIAGEEALESSGVDMNQTSFFNPERSGVVMGTAIGGMESLMDEHHRMQERGARRVSPYFIPKMIPNMASGRLSIDYGFEGPNMTVETACASGTDAIGMAYELIKRGDADLMVTGGTDSVFVPVFFAGLCATRAVSMQNDAPETASRPFDRARDGMVMGEGAAVLVLERASHARRRGAPILAEVCGYGTASDAHHLTAPDPEGKGQIQSMRQALEEAKMDPRDIDYINAHATSTPVGDQVETKSIKALFRSKEVCPPVSSTKGATGHLLGAAGAVETVFSVQAVQTGYLPPTIHYENEDPDCDLDYVTNEPRKASINRVLTNSFGFGGQNASLVIGRYTE